MADNTTAEFVGVRVVKEQKVDTSGLLGLQAVIQRAAEVGVNESRIWSL